LHLVCFSLFTIEADHYVSLISRCGGDVNKKDNWGNSAMDEVNKSGNKDMIKVLDKAIKMKNKGGNLAASAVLKN
jgi:hypothetical protein